MSGKLAGLQRRLAKVEKLAADATRRERLAGCICKFRGTATGVTLATSAEDFEGEMNRTCPVHGFRRLGDLVVVDFLNPDESDDPDSSRLHQLVEEYKLRLSQVPQADGDAEDDFQEA